MATIDKTVDQKTHLEDNATDPNVRVPDHVKDASTAADELHARFYPRDDAQTQAPNKEAIPQPALPEPVRADQTQGDPQPQIQAQVEQHHAPADDANLSADEWRHRFLSMQGRFNAAQRDKGAMEEQMKQLGQELVRTQAMLAAPPAVNQPQPGQNHEKLITDADRENYGDELIDLARRAGREAIGPELDLLRAENQRLNKQVSTTGKRELFAELDRVVPTWRQINTSIQFKSWLRLPNIYTGALRGNMLKAAVDGAEAPKVIALFKDFLAEAAATGQMAPAASVEQRDAQQQPVPRTPALDLETLAAPGRARPASGDSQVPSEKPIYSRADISKFYDDKRRGLYAGRQAAADAFEADLTVAQREGRIR